MKQRIFNTLCIFFLLFSLLPTGYEFLNRNRLHADRAFELVHNFPTDYNFYLSRIREGIEGRVTVIERYTSEPHQGSFIHVFYLWLGWLGRWVRVPWERAGDVYHIARMVFGMTLLLLIAEFAKKSFSENSENSEDQKIRLSEYLKVRFSGIPKLRLSEFSGSLTIWPLLAFLLAVTASTWPKFVTVDGTWRFGGYMPWWSVMDSLQRITFIPHLLAGQALILFLIVALADPSTLGKPGNWIFLGILAFLLGVILPPGLIFVATAAGFLVLLDLVRFILERKKKIWPALFAKASARTVVLLLGLPSLLYLNLMTSFYPWKRLTEFDILHPLPFDYLEYFRAVGPILPLGILGLLVAVKNREKRVDAAVAWVMAWGTLLALFHFVPEQSPLRFSEMIPQVPLAILAAYLFYNFYKTYKGYKRYIFLVLPLTMVVIGLGIMCSSFFWQRDFIDHKIQATLPLVPTNAYVMYPLKDWLAAMKFLQDATSRDTVILSETTAGNYLPVYSGNTVYVGHANTVRAEEKEALVKAFFSGSMRPSEAKGWLDAENLHYIFFGPQEKEDGGRDDLAKIYPFLEVIYENSFVTVYRVK